MIDYFENIRANSRSKAPFNLWPFQLKFALMCPRLIYRSFIYKNDSIETETFPGRDQPVLFPFDLSDYSRARSLTVQKLCNFASTLGVNAEHTSKKREIITQIKNRLQSTNTSSESARDKLARSVYWPEIRDKLPNIPEELRNQLDQAHLL